MRKRIFYRFLAMAVGFGLLASIAGGSLVHAAAGFDPSKVVFREVLGGLRQPLFLGNAGDGSGRLFVMERAGRIRIYKNGRLLPAPFLDIQSDVNDAGSEQGLLALAFHPNYPVNGRFYTVYTDQDGSLVLSRFLRSATDPNVANPNSRVALLTIPHPTHQNHNGGTLAFGPDRYLYWSTGDGGGGGDRSNNAQNLNVLLGKVLRLDVNHADPGLRYSIPSSNPFYNMPNRRGEIWAYGLRNPWRLSFDRQTGDLFIGDVGQNEWEEIDFQPAGSTGGENYGWRVMEGTHCFNPSTGCNQNGKVLPVAEYSHSQGCSVTGGYIYRGALYPEMRGRYFYGDFCSGLLFSLFDDPANGWTVTQVADTPYMITTFGEDEWGELYVNDYNAGTIYQICYGTISDFNLNVAGRARGNVSLCEHQVTYKNLPAVSGGPVRIRNTNQLPSIASQRMIFSVNDVPTSFSEMMGLPASQLDTVYWLPWYNNKSLHTQLRFANVSSSPATVHVSIGGAPVTGSPFSLAPGASLRKSFPGLDKGPVRLQSNQMIVASERVVYQVNGLDTSFSELMALPRKQLDSTYWLPWYNNVDWSTQLRFANVSGRDASVTVTIGGEDMGTFSLPPGASLRKSFTGIDAGPVKIESNGNIVASQRVIYKNAGGMSTSFSEMMALPASQLNSTYWLPWYSSKGLDTQLRFANASSSPATVRVYIAGKEMPGSPFALPAGHSLMARFPGIDKGPVQIVSDQNIVASQQVIYKVRGVAESFAEMMALPAGQLAATFWLPWYNNVEVNTQLRFGVP